MVLGILSVVFALLPLVSAWFMLLTTVNYVLAPVGIICGVVALIKSQNLVKSIVGLVLCVVAICLPFLMAELYLESAAESVGNAMDMLGNF